MTPTSLRFTDHPDLLAALRARPEWADLPIVRVMAADTENFDGDPIKEVIVLLNDTPANPVRYSPQDPDPRWNALVQVWRFVADTLWDREPTRFPVVNFKHTWQHNLPQVAAA